MKLYRGLLTPVAVLLCFILGLQSGGFQVALLSIGEEFGISGAQQGSLVSMQFLAIIFAPLIFGRVADRMGKKRVILIVGSLFAVGCLASALSPGAVVFGLSVFLLGCGSSVCEGMSSAALADANPGQATKYLNLSQCFFSLGAVAGPILAQWMINRSAYGWRMVFLLPAVGYLLLVAPLALTRFREIQPPPRKSAEENPGGRLLTRTFLALMATIFVCVLLEAGVSFYLNSLFTTQLQADWAAAFSVSLFWLAMVPSRIAAGALYRHQLVVVAGGFAASALALALLAFTANIPLALVCCCITGFAFGPMWPCLIGMSAAEHPGRTGTATSVMQAACGLGGLIAPVLMGWLEDIATIGVSFLTLAVFSLVGGGVFLMGKFNRQTAQEDPVSK